MSRPGRPSKLVPELLAKLREALEAGCTIQMACANAGIHVSTYHDWIGLASKRGGLYAELREMVRTTLAKVNVSAMKQIDAAAQPIEGEFGVQHGDWKAAAWRVEHTERILRNLDEHPDVVRAHTWRRAEWKPYTFAGGAATRRRKIDFLAHMEAKLSVNWTCRAARVHRWEFKQWCAEDPVFQGCVEEAALMAAYQAEEMLLRGALTLDKEGKVQTTAIFGILNAKSVEYGLLKAMLYARTNAKFVDEVADELLADLPADTATKLRDRLRRLQQRASGLPPGASLR